MVDPEGVTALSLQDYPYSCDPPCQVLSVAKESRFARLGFPSFNFDHSSFDICFVPQNHKEIELPLETWKCHVVS